MLSRLALVALAALVPAVAAQVPTLPFNLSYTPDLSITKVPLSKRADWCNGEFAVCDKLCGSQRATSNDCDSNTLNYKCICGNGTAPGLEYYQNSMPSFICSEAFSQCIDANVGNANGQRGCTTGVDSKCGKLDAFKADTGSASTTASGTSAGTAAPQGTAAATTTSHGMAAPTQVAQYLGAAAAAAVLGVFAL